MRGMPTRFRVVDFPQTEETDGRRAGGTSCIGDDVAMGGVSVGGSWWQGKSAVVHRVNPVEGELVPRHRLGRCAAVDFAA